jgi:adenine-specific DNA-methyltransferase
MFAKSKVSFLSLQNTLTRQKPNALEIIRKGKSLFSKIGKKTIPDEIKEVIKPFDYPNEILKDFEVIYNQNLIIKEFQSWLIRQNNFSEGEKAYKFIDQNGDVFQTVSMAWPNKEIAPDDYFLPLFHPINGKPCPIPNRGWRNPPSTMKSLLGNSEPINLIPGMVTKGDIVFTTDKKGDNNQPRSKYLLIDNLLENTPSIYNYGSSDDSFFTNIGLDFPYAKPVDVAKYLLKSVHPNPKIILDCFAGSGTTLHAIVELNSEDGKKRQGILVTNNEVDEKTEKKLLKEGIKKNSPEFEKEGICQKVTIPRLTKIISGYDKPNGDRVNGHVSNNLRIYKTAFLERDKTLKNKMELTLLATELLCIKEDCYDNFTNEIITSQLSWFKIFLNMSGCIFMIIYDDTKIDESVTIIQKVISLKKPEHKIKVYVFCNGQYPYTEEFEEVLEHIELCALPDAIYKAYQHVLPKKQRKSVPVLDEPESEITQTAENLNPNSDLFNQSN